MTSSRSLARYRIRSAIRGLTERGERIDPLTIQMELARRKELDAIGGPPAIWAFFSKKEEAA